MRSMWKGSITFGMVSVPVKMYKAHEEHKIEFHQVHGSCGCRIKFRRFCGSGVCGEVPYEEIEKGYEVSGGQNVIITDADLADLPLSTTHEIVVEQFVKTADVPAIYMSGQQYYLAPEEVGKRAYALLRGAVGSKGLAAIVRITMRQRERLAMLRVDGDVIIHEVLYWHDEVREPALPVLNDPVKLSTTEQDMARRLVSAMTGKFDPVEHTDHYQEALSELVNAKIAGTDIPASAPREPDPAPNMADQLAASLAALRKR